MASLEVEFETRCGKCGVTLDVTVTQKNGSTVLLIDPCSSCVRDARDDGEADGYERGCAEEK